MVTVLAMVSGTVTGGRTVTVTVTTLPAASVPMAQVIALVPVQLPCVVVTETRPTPGGMVSLATTAAAASGPPLVMRIV